MNQIMLSIYVVTYGHEKYIREALDSILMQKTKYTYEVLVGEDASPDNTREILREYEEKYPNIFRMYYREKNMRSINRSNANDLRQRCKGKYVIALEGDDFWIDDNKIEEQIVFLEKHPEYIAVAHNCLVVDQNSYPNGESYPECKDTEYTLRHFASSILPGQLTTVMYRNPYIDERINFSIMERGLMPGDRLLYFVLASYGKIYCIQEQKSAYRHVVSEGMSYSARYKYDYDDEKKWHEELAQYAKEIENKEAAKYADMLCLRCMCYGLRKHSINLGEFLKELKDLKFNHRVYCLYIKQLINHHILKKKIWV